MKRAVIYARVSTTDQSPESQILDLRQMAAQRGLEIVEQYVDHGVSGTRCRRPALDRMMADAHRGRFDVLLVWASDRLARSVKHFIDTLEELQRLNIGFISYREQLDTSGALGKAIMVIVSAIAELERSLIVERVKMGLRRARLEGKHIGRAPLEVDRAALVRDRERGMSLSDMAKTYRISRSSVCRVLREVRRRQPVSKTVVTAPSQAHENRPPETAA